MAVIRNSAQKKSLISRLKRVEGQARGIQQMILDDRPCESIAQQMSAARKAFNKAFYEMVACALEEHAKEGKSAAELSRRVREISKILAKYS